MKKFVAVIGPWGGTVCEVEWSERVEEHVKLAVSRTLQTRGSIVVYDREQDIPADVRAYEGAETNTIINGHNYEHFLAILGLVE